MTCRYKLFNLAKTYNKNLTQSDVQGMASSVLLAGLAIPPYDAASSAQGDAAAELEHERSMRMASILGFTVVRSKCDCNLCASLAWTVPSNGHYALDNILHGWL